MWVLTFGGASCLITLNVRVDEWSFRSFFSSFFSLQVWLASWQAKNFVCSAMFTEYLCCMIVSVMSWESGTKRYCKNTKSFLASSSSSSLLVYLKALLVSFHSFSSFLCTSERLCAVLRKYVGIETMMHVNSLKVINSLQLVDDYWFIIQHPMRSFSELFSFVVDVRSPLSSFSPHSLQVPENWET